jgi:LuxR family maltose regulon positive regulatory protein
MSAPLLTTKFNPPQARPNLVRRERLHQKLADGLTRRLTLVSAPPGFGKTTLVAEYLQNAGRPCAWLFLDEGDSDPARFITYLLAALNQVQPGIGQDIQPLLGAPQMPPVESLMASLINDLALAPAGLVIVLDDYHLIRNEAVHAGLRLLVERLPGQVHLVLITREDPPLPLPRLRGRGELVELRAADLRFSQEEASTYLLQSIGPALPLQALASLFERTEGWIAGLQMAALAIQSLSPQGDAAGIEAFIASFHGDDRFIMDYLLEEVFHRQPVAIQNFLLQTSILDQMSAPLCAAVLGQSREEVEKGDDANIPASSQQTLEYLERANLFTLPLDNRREWYRYHRLFADLLRHQLQRQHPQSVVDLHRRASRWYAQAGLPEEAMRHAQAAPDPALAADLAEQYLLQRIGGSQIASYLSWVRPIPDELIFRRAYLCAGCGWASAIVGQVEEAHKYVAAGEAALPSYQPVDSLPEGRQITREEVRGQLLAIRAYTDRLLGDFPAAVVHSSQALEALPTEAGSVRAVVAFNLGLLQMGRRELEQSRRSFEEALAAVQRTGENLYVGVSALSLLGSIAVQEGHLHAAENCYQRAIRMGTVSAGKAVPMPAIAYAHGGLVAVYYQRNELEAARSHLEKALPLALQIGQPETIAMAQIYQSRLAQAEGDFGQAEEWLRKAGELLRQPDMRDDLRLEYALAGCQLLLLLGDIPGAVRWIEAHRMQPLDPNELPGTAGSQVEQPRAAGARLAQDLMLARIRLDQGALQEAAELLEGARLAAEAGQDMPVLLEALALQAVATYQRPADAPRALPYLGRALDLGSGEQYVRPFLNAGEALIGLLRQAIVQNLQPGYAQSLLAALEEQTRRHARAKQASGLPLSRQARSGPAGQLEVEPLTEREQQVLRLLSAGLSSSEVAEELVLSVSTVRSYMKSLYAKLDAHSREEAIEKGRAAGMV